jgi:hypothetical protein
MCNRDSGSLFRNKGVDGFRGEYRGHHSGGVAPPCGRALEIATYGARGVVRRPTPSVIGLTPLLFRDRGYAQAMGTGATCGPALIPRKVSRPRTAAPCSSPAAQLAPSSPRPSSRA